MKNKSGSYFHRLRYAYQQVIKFILSIGVLLRCMDILKRLWVILLTLYPIIWCWWEYLFWV